MSLMQATAYPNNYFKMYFLRNCLNDTVFYLIKKEKFIIGRKNCDFIIQNDQSISKEHAAIFIKYGPTMQVMIEDLGSKYKTEYNGDQLIPKIEVPFLVNTTIKFGKFHAVYRLEKLDIVTTGTHFTSIEKLKLRKILTVLGGIYLENWDSTCTHLTVKEMYVTIKVLHALIDEKPIIVLDYWSHLYNSALNNNLPPDIKNFNKPPVAEPLLANINFTNKVDRKSLFQNKTLIFSTDKTKKMMETVIEKTGGKCAFWQTNISPPSKILESLDSYIIIQVPNEDESAEFQDLVKALLKNKKRTIPIQEIAMAIISGSCDKYCNPDFDKAGTVVTKLITKSSTQVHVLAHNTKSEDVAFETINDNETTKVVPDTFDPPLEPSLHIKKETPVKEKANSLSIEPTPEDITSASVEQTPEVITNSKKRKCEIELIETILKQQKMDTPDPNAPNTSKVFHQDLSSAIPDKDDIFPASSTEEENKRTIVAQVKPLEEVNPFSKFMKRSRPATATSTGIPEKRLKSAENSQRDKTEERKIFKSSNRNIFQVSLPSTSFFEKTANILSSIRQNMDCNPEKTSIQSSGNTSEYLPWMSKPTKSKDTSSESIDLELKIFSELFKGKAVIKYIEPETYMRETSVYGYNIENSGRKNFKKFKKVMPLRPQPSILHGF